ncbi:MAG: hypothetical protein QME74_11520 [Candidatus Edwardsbacteria bacterium]|nr:hypothetical protein [Candidatus Edwardsbacteria bacterium]
MAVVRHIERAIAALDRDIHRLDREIARLAGRKETLFRMRTDLLRHLKTYQSGGRRRYTLPKKRRTLSEMELARIREVFSQTDKAQWPDKRRRLSRQLRVTVRQIIAATISHKRRAS